MDIPGSRGGSPRVTPTSALTLAGSNRLDPAQTMPEGLVNVLTKEDLLDLLAYMEAGGKRDHPVFKP